MGSREGNNWHLYILGTDHRGARMKIFKALWLSVHGTENISHRVRLEELGKVAVGDGHVERMERELRVC